MIEDIITKEEGRKLIVLSDRIEHLKLLKKRLDEREIISSDLFESKFICDMDLRYSGILVGKKSFMNLECFFYTKSNFDFKSNWNGGVGDV